MGMNELDERLRVFDQALGAFQEVLRAALVAVGGAEQRLAGLWDDDFGRAFTQRYSSLNVPLLDAAHDIDERIKPDVEGRIAQIRGYFS